MLSHTPPALHPLASSYEASHQKRPRSGSLTSRLRSASDLEERGIIDQHEKGIMKDLIISGDERLQTALDRFESGDPSELEVLMHSGVLTRRGSMDLLEDLDLSFLQASLGGGDGGLGASGSHSALAGDVSVDVLQELIGGQPKSFDLNFDDMAFEASFESAASSIGSNNSTADALKLGGTPPSPSMLGRTPPDPFSGSFEELRMTSSRWPGGLTKHEDVSSSSAMAIPGVSHRIGDMVESSLTTDRRGRSDGAASSQPHAPQPPSTPHTNSRQRQRSHATPGASPPPPPPPDEAGSKHGYIGAYSPDARRKRIQRFLEKRKKRVWTKKVKYDVRKNFADSRMRVKGRFVKKEDEELLRELMSIT